MPGTYRRSQSHGLYQSWRKRIKPQKKRLDWLRPPHVLIDSGGQCVAPDLVKISQLSERIEVDLKDARMVDRLTRLRFERYSFTKQFGPTWLDDKYLTIFRDALEAGHSVRALARSARRNPIDHPKPRGAGDSRGRGRHRLLYLHDEPVDLVR